MIWQVALFLNIIFGTIRGYLDKRLVSQIDPYLAFFYSAFWATIFYTLFYILRHESLPYVYLEMMLLGILFVFVIGSYLYAIRINLSQSVIFSSYYLVISMILAAVFLGEWQLFDPSTSSGQKTIIGVIMAFISIWLLLTTGSKKEIKLERLWIILMAVNIILNGIGTFWGKLFLQNHGPLETLISQSIGGVPVIFLILIVRRQKFTISPTYLKLTIINGFVMVLAVTLFYEAVRKGPLMIILPIQTLVMTIAIALIGLILYKESHFFTKKKLIGIVLGVLGVVMLVV